MTSTKISRYVTCKRITQAGVCIDLTSTIQGEYCPPLDPALLSAILSDYDLYDQHAVSQARQTLDSLKESAVDHEYSGFDPSGTTAPDDAPSSARPESCPEAWALRSEGTDLTSLSNGMQSLEIGGALGSQDEESHDDFRSEYLARVEQSDDATKLQALQEIFPKATKYSISHTLMKCDGGLDRAMDEMLNHAFFATEDVVNGDERVMAKGIDAFYVDEPRQRGRKKAKNKARYRSAQDYDQRASSLPSSPTATGDNPWKTGSKDIEFISDRTGIAYGTVSSLFYHNGASIPATIKALLLTSADANNGAKLLTSVPRLQDYAFELGQEFPTIEPGHLTELIRLTYPSTAAAHELAKAMTKRTSRQGGLEIIPRYAPIKTDEEPDSSWTTVSPSSSTFKHGRHIGSDPSMLASTYALAGNRAYEQASAAYRRGRSDHLMSQAAGYYSQVGRDFATMSREATAGAADAMVASQSVPGQVDLHGVSVKDAVRIARARTANWWRANGRRTMGLDGRVRQEDSEGSASAALVIVTGMGKHSKGGRGLLGPAVGKMLAQEGWHARCEEGMWVVTAKRR